MHQFMFLSTETLQSITFPPIYVSGTDAQINPIIGAATRL